MLHRIKRSFSILNKAIFIGIIFFLIINLFAIFMGQSTSLNNTDPIEEKRVEMYRFINDPNNSKTKEGKFSVQLYKFTICTMIGEGCTNNPNDAEQYFKNSGLGKMAYLISIPYTNPPASATYWAINGLQKAGFVPNTYAAEGIGFSAIKPYIELWSRMRDLAYMILVLVIVSIGFMVMFRMKLNPQTVMSVESALPKIIISLLYITFSFAIAGFLIDLMYVLIVVGVSVLSKADSTLPVNQLQNQYLSASFGTIWESMFTKQSVFPVFGGFSTLFSLGDAIVGLLPQVIGQLIRGIGVLLFGLQGAATILNVAGLADWAKALNSWSVIGNSLGELPGTLGSAAIRLLVIVPIILLTLIYGAGWVVGILIGLTMLLLLFRIFFMLFMGYLKVLLLVVFAPIFMLFEAIPGRHAFSYWFKALISELLMFPIVIFLIVLGRILVNTTMHTGADKLWHPPFIYPLQPEHLSILIGMGIIFMIPELVKLSKDFMGAKGLPVGLNLSTFFAGVGTGTGGAMSVASQFYTLRHGLSAVLGETAVSGGIFNIFKGKGGSPH
jgi:hypothetical protein